ncbi:LOW QUALITY PROTEIN: rap1 GTPase-activating protein 1 [Sarcoramphus papa]
MAQQRHAVPPPLKTEEDYIPYPSVHEVLGREGPFPLILLPQFGGYWIEGTNHQLSEAPESPPTPAPSTRARLEGNHTAKIYRKHFLGKEHFNYYSLDPALGHLVFSLKYDEQEHLHLLLRTRARTLHDVVPISCLAEFPNVVQMAKLVCEDINVDRFYPVLYPKASRLILAFDEHVLRAEKPEPPDFSCSSSSASSFGSATEEPSEPGRESRSPLGTHRDAFTDTPWPDDPPGIPPGCRPSDPPCPEIKIQLERPPNLVRLCSPTPFPSAPRYGGTYIGVHPLMSLRTGLIVTPPSPGGGGGGGVTASPPPPHVPPSCQELKPSSPVQDLGGDPPKNGCVCPPPSRQSLSPQIPLGGEGGGVMDHKRPPPRRDPNATGGGSPKMKSGSNPSITPSLKKKRGGQIQGKPKVGLPPPLPPFILREKSSGMCRMLEFGGGGGGNYFFKPPQIVFVFPLRQPTRRRERHLAGSPGGRRLHAKSPAKKKRFPPPLAPPNPQKPRSTPGPVKHSSVPPGFWEAPAPGVESRLGMPAMPAMPARVQRALSKVGVSQGPPPLTPKSRAARVIAFARSKVCRLIKKPERRFIYKAEFARGKAVFAEAGQRLHVASPHITLNLSLGSKLP